MKRRIRNPFPRSVRMACEQVGELLRQYLDDHVEEGLADLLDAHLEDCRRCGLEAETYRGIKAALATRRDPVPAESLERLREFAHRTARAEEAGTGL